MKFITFTHSHNKDDNVIKYFKESIKDYYDYNFGNKIPEIMIINNKNNTLKVFNYEQRRRIN